MFEINGSRWIIGLIAFAGIIILLDEVAYHIWKKANPGAMYSHLSGKTITPVDPARPPTTIYYGG